MAFSYVWDVTTPADSEDINLGAGRIRDGKSAIQERVAVDHSFLGDANDGLHKHSEYIPQGAVTPVNATDGVVYVALVAGVAELFYKDTAGHTLQITTGGVLRLVNAAVTGTLTATGNITAQSALVVNGDTDLIGAVISMPNIPTVASVTPNTLYRDGGFVKIV